MSASCRVQTSLWPRCTQLSRSNGAVHSCGEEPAGRLAASIDDVKNLGCCAPDAQGVVVNVVGGTGDGRDVKVVYCGTHDTVHNAHISNGA